MGSVWHAIWAGIPLGLCFLAFTPPSFVDRIGKVIPFSKASRSRRSASDGAFANNWATPTDQHDFAWVDESNYYYIKVENEFEDPGETQKRTLVLDNLIHGYFILDHPERLDYDYEHIYALVAYRTAKASGNVKFKKPRRQAGPVPGRPEAAQGEQDRRQPRKLPKADSKRRTREIPECGSHG